MKEGSDVPCVYPPCKVEDSLDTGEVDVLHDDLYTLHESFCVSVISWLSLLVLHMGVKEQQELFPRFLGARHASAGHDNGSTGVSTWCRRLICRVRFFEALRLIVGRLR